MKSIINKIWNHGTLENKLSDIAIKMYFPGVYWLKIRHVMANKYGAGCMCWYDLWFLNLIDIID